MSWLFAALTALLVWDGLRLRRRLTAFPVLAVDGDVPAVALDHRFIIAAGVFLDEPTRRTASRFAEEHGLDLLDLVPGDLSAAAAMTLVQAVDPACYRENHLGPARSAGHAILVTADLLRRAEGGAAAEAHAGTPLDAVALFRIATRLKRHCTRGAELVVAPRLASVAAGTFPSRAWLAELFGGSLAPVLVLQTAFLGTLAAGPAVALPWGVLALAAYHLQPLLCFAGVRLRPRDLAYLPLVRLIVDLRGILAIIVGRAPPSARSLRKQTLGPVYAGLLAEGADRFFEPRRATCPLCGGTDLAVHLRVGDLLQHKPGRFTLDRCAGCRHLFQNPRLSMCGLDFYYRDFYDGLGEQALDAIFGASVKAYQARVQMVDAVATPRAWLDVGCGHGHFCASARKLHAEARFDGLDISVSVEEAARRGWIDEAHRGLFPALAPALAGRYDVVSMSHYLEHTLDPRAEIAAAHRTLEPAGLLLIEVPDPDCPLGRFFGRFWLPWFQPQHLHLVSTRNMDRLLREQGFTPLEWHRGRAHVRVDLLAAVGLALGALAPEPGLPWRGRASVAGRAFHALIWALGMIPLLVARMLDLVLGPLIERVGWANAYRVLARRS